MRALPGSRLASLEPDPLGRPQWPEAPLPMKPPKPIKRSRKRIPYRSAKREGQADERAAVIARVWARDGGCCTARGRVPHECSDQLDVHEICPRSAWALGYLAVDNCVLVCRRAHDWIDNHPAEAHDLGLHQFSWERT